MGRAVEAWPDSANGSLHSFFLGSVENTDADGGFSYPGNTHAGGSSPSPIPPFPNGKLARSRGSTGYLADARGGGAGGDGTGME